MKYYGKVGYVTTVEGTDGVWQEQKVEKYYYGDVLKNTKRNENGEGLNDNIQVNNQISIIADAYANNHFFAIKYAMWQGVMWNVTNVDVQPPRLILSLGGVYSGASL